MFFFSQRKRRTLFSLSLVSISFHSKLEKKIWGIFGTSTNILLFLSLPPPLSHLVNYTGEKYLYPKCKNLVILFMQNCMSYSVERRNNFMLIHPTQRCDVHIILAQCFSKLLSPWYTFQYFSLSAVHPPSQHIHTCCVRANINIFFQ